VAAAVSATLRQVHPEMNAEQIIALAKKQAGDPANWDRLKPVEGREYRGAGLPNALDAVLKDQAKPVIGSVEYSTDGTTWQPLAGESVSGRVSIRVTVTGPVTSARLLVGEREVATGVGNGAFEGNSVMLQADGVERRRKRGAGGHDPEAHALPDLGLERLLVVLEGHPVEGHEVGGLGGDLLRGGPAAPGAQSRRPSWRTTPRPEVEQE